jgi:hypothetical protein
MPYERDCEQSEDCLHLKHLLRLHLLLLNQNLNQLRLRRFALSLIRIERGP